MARSLGTKLYYSIGEVAEITDLAPYTLRAWESEFACLRPKRVRGKNRAYRRRDIAIILLIRRLLHEERYSTRGAQQKLRTEPDLIRLAVEHLEGVQDDVPLLLRTPGAEPLAVAATADPDPTQDPERDPFLGPGPETLPAVSPRAEAAGQLLRHVRTEIQAILALLR